MEPKQMCAMYILPMTDDRCKLAESDIVIVSLGLLPSACGTRGLGIAPSALGRRIQGKGTRRVGSLGLPRRRLSGSWQIPCLLSLHYRGYVFGSGCPCQ